MTTNRDTVIRDALSVCGRFLLWVPLCLVAWLCLMPGYVWVLGHGVALVLSGLLGEAISSVNVEPAGLLNSETGLAYVVSGKSSTMAGVGRLVVNVAPFVALVLATPSPWRRRMRALGMGLPSLALLHAATIVLLFEAGRATLPIVTGFIAVTLPFLLWIVLLYWDRLGRR